MSYTNFRTVTGSDVSKPETGNEKDIPQTFWAYLAGYLWIKKVAAQDIWRYCSLFPRSYPGELRRADNRCVNGHLYEGNCYFYKSASGKTRRQCKTCKKLSDQSYHRSTKIQVTRVIH